MSPEARRRLESLLNDDSYTCERCCSDLPYTLWNTCPLCICGLMPVLVVCFSALFRLDYATHVTDIGAKIINEMGLSYTVYYTAGCWPTLDPEAQPQGPESLDGGDQSGLGSLRLHSRRCNSEQFEIAAGEFDALSGSLLRVRNVTRLRARRVEAVRVSPDWRYIVFVASLANDIGMLYAVGAEETDAEKAVPLLHEKQLDALDAQCQLHSQGVLAAAGFSDGDGRHPKPLARLAGYKHLQVIIPGVDPSMHESDAEAEALKQATPGSSPRYRAAFAFECTEPGGPLDLPMRGPGVRPLRFSKLALLDFQLHGLDVARRGGPPGPKARARSELRILDAVPAAPADVGEDARKAISRFRSQSCPRFVPSKRGGEVLFVAEDLVPERQAPTPSPSAWLPPPQLPPRRLGLVAVPPAAWQAAQQPEQQPPPPLPAAGPSLPASMWPPPMGGPLATATGRQASQRRLLMCCEAMTAECMACKQDVSVDDFCARSANAGVPGCDARRKAQQGAEPPKKACCRARTAKCLACVQGISEEEFCRDPGNQGVPGCSKPQPACCNENEARCLACLEGKSVLEYCEESGDHAGVRGCEQSAQDLERLHVDQQKPYSFMALKADSTLLNIGLGEGVLPYAPVQGCPEFVPTLYSTSQNLAETFKDRLFNRGAKKEAEAQLAERRFRDTFVILSDPTSASVLGVDAQVLAVSLPEGPVTGAVSRVQLLYNVGNAPGSLGIRAGGGRERLRLGGCGPIRAAGRQGHMRLQSVVETLMATLNLHTEKSGYTAWLACLTADQRVAIVESPKREHWINMSMPYPMWTGKTSQAIWCPNEREEACFEVWSNPNPNE